MTINNKKKVGNDQNLIPSSLVNRRLLNIILMPALVSVIAIILVAALIRFGIDYTVPKLTDKLQLEIDDVTKQSLVDQIEKLKVEIEDIEAEREEKQNAYDNYYENNPFDVVVDQSNLAALQNTIDRLEAELKNLEAGDGLVEVLEKYRVQELFAHIDSIRTENVTLISMEDLVSFGYASSSSHLVYENDIGETTFSLHGLATNPNELSTFLMNIKKSDAVKDAIILSVETHTVNTDENIYVFEVHITPNVLEKEVTE